MIFFYLYILFFILIFSTTILINKYVEDIFKSNIPKLQTGVFLSLLDQDKIEGITKNTEGWLENFRGLTTVK